MSETLRILHFNDVYRIAPQKLSSRTSDTIDVTQFAAGLNDVRDQWPLRGDGKRDGLVLFSGDVFSPSVESSVTRGSHMVPVMNFLAPDVSMTGNHDFDFGYLHLTDLIKDCKFPWLLSNVVDTVTSEVPATLKEFDVIERSGIRVGIIGLVEKEWITTVPTWPQNFVYKDMKQVGIDLSTRLRDSNGPYRCDIIIALTHCRLPNDIKLAKDLSALSPSVQHENPIAALHGIDVVLGGHDHMYYISKGVSSWEGYDVEKPSLGAEQDHGDVLVVKSGTDFRDLSDFTLTLASTPTGSVRKKVIHSIKGRRIVTKPGSKSSKELTELLKNLISSVSKSLTAPVCKSVITLDLRSNIIRTEESAAGNWFADIIRHAYDDCETLKGSGGSDAVLICAGTLRGDSEYGPGNISLGDILEILPFDDPLVVLELDGDAIWSALESSLSTWPAQEGRFPVLSGMRVTWDSRREPGDRITSISLTKEMENSIYNGSGGSGYSTPRVVNSEPVPRVKGGKKYKIVSREYMAQGHDGFIALQGRKYLVDDERGQPMSSIVRKYLLGSQYVNRLVRITEHPSTEDLCEGTKNAVRREQAHRRHHQLQSHSKAVLQWKHAAELAVNWVRSRAHYQDHLNISTMEHMSCVDAHDGKHMRTSSADESPRRLNMDEDLLVINPRVDGRLEDIVTNFLHIDNIVSSLAVLSVFSSMMNMTPHQSKIGITFPRTDSRSPNATAEIFTKAQTQGKMIRKASDKSRKNWLEIITHGLYEAGVLNTIASNENLKLVDFPQGYELIQVRCRNDWRTSLIGSPYAGGRTGFQSAVGFIPHAIWLFRNPELDHSMCAHWNNSRCSQNNKISKNQTSQPLPHLSSISSSILGTGGEDHEFNQLVTLQGSTALMDYRKGEVVWAALSTAVAESLKIIINLWPAVILGSVTGSKNTATTRYQIQPFGPLQSRAYFVQESRILPFNTYMLPPDLIDSLRSALQTYRINPVPTSISSSEPFSVSFEEADCVSYHNVKFEVAALPYIQALYEAIERVNSYEIPCHELGSVFLSPRILASTPKISFVSSHHISIKNPDFAKLRWGAEYIQIGDFVRLRTARKELVFLEPQFIHPPSGPRHFIQLKSHFPELGGAFSRGLFLRIVAWKLVRHPEHPENASTINAVGILHEVADDLNVAPQDDLSELDKFPEVYYGYRFCPIVKTGYAAVVPLDDINGRHYPPPMISTYYSLHPESMGSATPSQYHLQMLAGLWPDDNSSDQKKYSCLEAQQGQPQAIKANDEQLASALHEFSKAVKQRDNNFEKHFPTIFIKTE